MIYALMQVFSIKPWLVILIMLPLIMPAKNTARERCRPKNPGPPISDLCYRESLKKIPPDPMPKFVLQNADLTEYVAHICNGCKKEDFLVLCQCDGTNDQTWEMHGNVIVNVKTGLALQINGSTEGSAVMMKPGSGHCDQQWFFDPDGSIRHANGLFLDVRAKKNCSSHLGAYLIGSNNCRHHKWIKREF